MSAAAEFHAGGSREEVADFREAIRAAGLAPPEVIEPGKLHRFPGAGKRNGNTAGWAKMFDDGDGGVFGDWSTGLCGDWRAKRDRPFSKVEREAFKRRVEEAQAQAGIERAELQAEAAQRAAAIWHAAQPAPADHPYLVRKSIQPHGARIHKDRLVIPVRTGGDLVSLQFIAENGGKWFLTGGRVAGGYFPVGNADGAAALCVAEGFATGATIHQATGCPIAVAFTAGNLEPVALAMRAKFPDLRLILCADDDYLTDGNPGLAKATEAARSVGGLVAVPDFGPDRPDGATDFNDLHQARGLEAVRLALESASEPVIGGHQPGDLDAPAGDDGNGWPDPRPLPGGLPPVRAFDMALLPDSLRPWVGDIAERVQCAPEFVAVAAIGALGAVIGRKVGIRPQARTDWTVTPNQWALIVGRPGVLKSPAIEAALAPVKRLAAQALETYDAAAKLHVIEAKAAKLRAEEGEKAARAVLKKTPGADVSAYLATDDPPAPLLRRYIAVDSNAASLGELHRQNPNGLLVHRDEMVSLLRSLDREDQAEARGFYLTGWNGDSGYTFDRIGRGLNLHIPAVCLSMLGSTQPGRIAEYVRHAVRGGAGDDGLIQRFGLLVWPDGVGDWRNVDRWPDGDAKRCAYEVFERLDRLEPDAVGAQRDEGIDGEPDGLPYLRFDADALGLFVEWRADLEERLRSGDLHPAMESHLAKYRKLVPGLALILHLADGGTGPVTHAATLRALAWAELLESHAARVYASVSAPDVAAAKAILGRIRKGDLPAAFTGREVWRHGWTLLSDLPQVNDALALLLDFGWLVAARTDTGGRPSVVYTVNPRGLS